MVSRTFLCNIKGNSIPRMSGQLYILYNITLPIESSYLMFRYIYSSSDAVRDCIADLVFDCPILLKGFAKLHVESYIEENMIGPECKIMPDMLVDVVDTSFIHCLHNFMDTELNSTYEFMKGMNNFFQCIRYVPIHIQYTTFLQILKYLLFCCRNYISEKKNNLSEYFSQIPQRKTTNT